MQPREVFRKGASYPPDMFSRKEKEKPSEKVPDKRAEVYTVCTQCNRVLMPAPSRKHSAPVLRLSGGDDDQWINFEDISSEQVVPTAHNLSHGLCSSCFKRMDKLISHPSSSSPSSPTSTPPRALASSTSSLRRPSLPSVTNRILVVDDNKLQRLIHKRIVEQAGYSCDVACSAQQAVEMVAKHSYSLVLMDLMMSGTDGWQGAKEIRKLMMMSGGAAAVPKIVAVTGMQLDDALRTQCADAGMEDILPKPVSAARLGNILAKFSPQAL